MKRGLVLTGAVVAVCVLLLALAWRLAVPVGVLAQEPGERGPAAAIAAGAVSSQINYQGVLKEEGQPVTGARNFTFRLYTGAGCSVQTGEAIVLNDVAVSDGLFSVKLDVDQALFDGQGLWLGVDVGNSGSSVSCEAITPVPYALSLRPGAVISGSIEDGPVLEVSNTFSSTAEMAASAAAGANAILEHDPDAPAAVVGLSGSGVGVLGNALTGPGVQGSSTYGPGGMFATGSKFAWALEVTGNGGAALFRGGDVRVEGEIYARSLHTVDASGKQTSGVTTEGNANYRQVQVPASGGKIEIGRDGMVMVTEPAGRTSASISPMGAGKFMSLTVGGDMMSELTVENEGIVTARVDATGSGQFSSLKTCDQAGYACAGMNSNGLAVTQGRNTAATIDAAGNAWFGGQFTARGTKSAIVPTANYGLRKLYADESAAVYFFDRGQGQLIDGAATIVLDPIWLETVTVDAAHPMLVQVTLTSDCNGVFVAEKTAASFTVRELQGGASNATFDWEVAAIRAGYEDERLAPVPAAAP